MSFKDSVIIDNFITLTNLKINSDHTGINSSIVCELFLETE